MSSMSSTIRDPNARLQPLLPELDSGIRGVILFDGYCRFCRGVVGWLLRTLSPQPLRICSTRSTRGSEICHAMGQNPADTFAFVVPEKASIGVDAYSELLELVPRTRMLARLIRGTPTWLSLGAYDWIARHRSLMSRVFGRSNPPLPPEYFIAGGEN
jgi:predicted DCC family thiol-disulfide oxidoreductase YuxK